MKWLDVFFSNKFEWLNKIFYGELYELSVNTGNKYFVLLIELTVLLKCWVQNPWKNDVGDLNSSVYRIENSAHIRSGFHYTRICLILALDHMDFTIFSKISSMKIKSLKSWQQDSLSAVQGAQSNAESFQQSTPVKLKIKGFVMHGWNVPFT